MKNNMSMGGIKATTVNSCPLDRHEQWTKTQKCLVDGQGSGHRATDLNNLYKKIPDIGLGGNVHGYSAGGSGGGKGY